MRRSRVCRSRPGPLPATSDRTARHVPGDVSQPLRDDRMARVGIVGRPRQQRDRYAAVAPDAPGERPLGHRLRGHGGYRILGPDGLRLRSGRPGRLSDGGLQRLGLSNQCQSIPAEHHHLRDPPRFSWRVQRGAARGGGDVGIHECVADVRTCSPASSVQDSCGSTIACGDICGDSTATCCNRPGSGCSVVQSDGKPPSAGDLVITFCP
jgi:hypothetical protein